MCSEYRLVILGAGGVGKSSAVNRFIDDRFSSFRKPTIENWHKWKFTVDEGKFVNLNIIDTAGSTEHSSANRQMYYKYGEGFILVYDITNKASFLVIKQIYEEIRNARMMGASEHLPIVLVGNKSDLALERAVQMGEGEILADEFGCQFIETSAKEDINLDEVFQGIVSEIRENNNNYLLGVNSNQKKCIII